MNDPIHLLLIKILSDVLTGQKEAIYRIKDRSTYLTLQKLSISHSVFPMLIDGILSASGVVDDEEKCLPASKRMLDLYRDRIILQAKRTADFLLFYEYLGRKGLHPAVMKGIVCRDLYPEPEHRSSVDEDLLIDPREFEQYHEAITSYGLSPVDSSNGYLSSSEVSYENKEKHLYIELHKTPFSTESGFLSELNNSFEGVYNREITLEIYKTEIRTLGHTDHLLYLLLHAFKHFLYSGFGIRQVCDIILFSKEYNNEIDWKRIEKELRQVNALEFACAIYKIGNVYILKYQNPEEYIGLPGLQRMGKIDEMPLLEDIMKGGIYGVSDINRAHSAEITLSAVERENKGSRFAKFSGILRSIFPDRRYLQRQFPYAKKNPILLPAAWAERIFEYLRGRKGESGNPIESIRIGQERLGVLKEYKVIS